MQVTDQYGGHDKVGIRAQDFGLLLTTKQGFLSGPSFIVMDRNMTIGHGSTKGPKWINSSVCPHETECLGIQCIGNRYSSGLLL